MSHEFLRPTDLRAVLSTKKQTAYGTALLDADLAAGVSIAPTDAVMPFPSILASGNGPRAFTGHEWSESDYENEQARDLAFSLSMEATPWLFGWASALALGKVTSVQDAASTHYTHTMIPLDPIAAAGTRQAKVTTVYMEATGPDADRWKSFLPSLAVQSVGLTVRPLENAQLAVELLGSGKEDTSAFLSATPTLTGGSRMPWRGVKFEIGISGALQDWTDRLRELGLTLTQELAAGEGYIPNAATPADGRFRSRIDYISRALSFDFALRHDRTTSLKTTLALKKWVEDRQLLAAKFTFDTGIRHGGAAGNLAVVIDVPEFRLPSASPDFDESGAIDRFSVSSEMISKVDASTEPFTLTVDNDEEAYLD